MAARHQNVGVFTRRCVKGSEAVALWFVSSRICAQKSRMAVQPRKRCVSSHVLWNRARSCGKDRRTMVTRSEQITSASRRRIGVYVPFFTPSQLIKPVNPIHHPVPITAAPLCIPPKQYTRLTIRLSRRGTDHGTSQAVRKSMLMSQSWRKRIASRKLEEASVARLSSVKTLAPFHDWWCHIASTTAKLTTTTDVNSRW